MSFYQIVLPTLTLIFLFQVFIYHTWRQWKVTGINPYVFSKTESAHDYCGRVYKIMIVGTWLSIGLYAFFPSFYKYILPIWYLEIEWLQHLGFGLILLSLGWIVIAQNQMSKSWRIGINYSEKTELVRFGLFKVSRNPIFLGVIASYIGTFLIIPNALSLSILFITFVVLQIQVRLEEEYLFKVHGTEYVSYKSKTRRWL